MKENSLAELVEDAAKARNDAKVPREYINDALNRIERGQTEVERYPTGHPTLKGVYGIALELYKSTKN
jgi:hypothetical protein